MSDDSGFDPNDYVSEPLTFNDIDRAHYTEQFSDYDSAVEGLYDLIPDEAPEGVYELVDYYLDVSDLDYEDIIDLMAEWDDVGDFWDWFRDEFYGEN